MILLSEVEKYPDEYFLWTSLAQTCSRLGDYFSALAFSTKAIEKCDADVLVLYNHVTALIETESYNEALPFCQQILEKNAESIAQNGEGIRWAKSIRLPLLVSFIAFHLSIYRMNLFRPLVSWCHGVVVSKAISDVVKSKYI